MKHKHINAAFGSVLTMALFAVVLAGVVVAQGRYTGQYSRADVDTIIRNVEDRADEFRRDFYNELDRSNLNASQRRIYRQQVENFENSTDRLRTNFNNDNTWWRSRSQVQAVISNSQPLNTTMNSIAFRRNVERQWNQLRNAVNRLADTFDLPGIAGGGWTGGGPGWGSGSATRPPSWAQGTFNSRNVAGFTMSIDANGRVTLSSYGGTTYGRWHNGTIYINGDQYPATRTQYGMRAYNRYTGETTEYARTGSGGGNDGGWGGGNETGGPTSNPPDWARGTFESTNIRGYTMTINANGRVTLYSNGSTSYGRYYNGSVYVNNEVYPITRSGNGLRALDRRTGNYTNYRRQ